MLLLFTLLLPLLPLFHTLLELFGAWQLSGIAKTYYVSIKRSGWLIYLVYEFAFLLTAVEDVAQPFLVVTDEDYINFMSNALSEDREKKHLPLHLEALLTTSTILFLGYSLEDWNFRLLFKATGETNARKKYAIQLLTPLDSFDHPEQERAKRTAVERFWDRKGIDIIDVEAEVFMSDLLEEIAGNAPSE